MRMIGKKDLSNAEMDILTKSCSPTTVITANGEVTTWVVDVILLQVGLKCFSMRMTLDLLHELANAEVLCLFHNCMWQSWHSEVNVYFLELGQRLSTHGSPRSCLIRVYVFVCVFVFVYKFNGHWHLTLDGCCSIHRSLRS